LYSAVLSAGSGSARTFRISPRARTILVAENAEIHVGSGGAYGAMRVTRELCARGQVVNKKRVVRIMRERGIAGFTR